MIATIAEKCASDRSDRSDFHLIAAIAWILIQNGG